MNDQDDALVARHGWASLLLLLTRKGLITEAESHQVILDAYEGASKRAALDNQEVNGKGASDE